ncbi:MAG TPA: glycosyltransferase family 4 protein [Candidatus Acidoferrum sp.]|jgi:glycosyltransferase involved in cell wall biosynthesis|nr:glycosyltransferase family 4 protein [Candidatus Acidoferrum sp.]
MPDRRYRVLAIATHPAQYQAPLFRRMAARADLDLHVAYCTLRGAEAAHDPEFGATVKWDIPLLDGYAWTHVPNKGSGAESFFGLRNSGIWKMIRKGKFDAVLCYVGYVRASFWIACLSAKLSRAAVLFGTDATTLAPRDGRMWKRHVKRIFWPILFRIADQVIVPSSGSVALMRSLGLPEERITLTPYVVDNDWWLTKSACVDRAAVRASWNAAAKDTVILFCAKLQRWKRPLDLLRAFANANILDVLLIFAGEGPLRRQLEIQTASLGISDRVRFLGLVNQSQLPAVYTSADMMVLPSEYEPFGVVVNEAMLCGCPVAASDHVGAARDLIAHGRNGFVFPCGNVAALAAILQQVSAAHTRLSEMGRVARARMESWSPRENIQATLTAVARGVSRKVGRPVPPSAQPSAQAAAPRSSSGGPQKLPE